MHGQLQTSPPRRSWPQKRSEFLAVEKMRLCGLPMSLRRRGCLRVRFSRDLMGRRRVLHHTRLARTKVNFHPPSLSVFLTTFRVASRGMSDLRAPSPRIDFILRAWDHRHWRLSESQKLRG